MPTEHEAYTERQQKAGLHLGTIGLSMSTEHAAHAEQQKKAQLLLRVYSLPGEVDCHFVSEGWLPTRRRGVGPLPLRGQAETAAVALAPCAHQLLHKTCMHSLLIVLDFTDYMAGLSI